MDFLRATGQQKILSKKELAADGRNSSASCLVLFNEASYQIVQIF
jgi:hypothetical protein